MKEGDASKACPALFFAHAQNDTAACTPPAPHNPVHHLPSCAGPPPPLPPVWPVRPRACANPDAVVYSSSPARSCVTRRRKVTRRAVTASTLRPPAALLSLTALPVVTLFG